MVSVSAPQVVNGDQARSVPLGATCMHVGTYMNRMQAGACMHARVCLRVREGEIGKELQSREQPRTHVQCVLEMVRGVRL